MYIEINTKNLQELALKAIKGAGMSPLLPITSALHIEASQNILYLTTTDGSTTLKVSADEVCDAKFVATADAKLFVSLVSKFTSPTTRLKLHKDKLELVANGVHYVELMQDYEGNTLEMPEFISGDAKIETEEIALDWLDLALTANKAVLVSRVTDTRFDGYCFRKSGISTSDGVRLAFTQGGIFKEDVMIGANVIQLLSLYDHNKITVNTSDDRMQFKGEGFELTCTTKSPHAFPDEGPLLNTKHAEKVRIVKDELGAVLARMLVYSAYSLPVVTIDFKGGEAIITNKASKAREEIQAEVLSGNGAGQVCVNAQLLLDLVKGHVDTYIVLSYNNEEGGLLRIEGSQVVHLLAQMGE